MNTRTPRKLKDNPSTGDFKIDITGLDTDVEIPSLDDDATPPPPQAPAVAPIAEDIIEKMRKELDETNAKLKAEADRNDRLEAERHEQSKTVVNARTQALNSDFQRIESDMAVINTEIEQLLEQQAEALDTGDNRKAAEITRKIARLDNKLIGAEYAKKQIEEQIEKADSSESQSSTVDISSYTKATQDWIKAHPKFLEDKKYYNTALAAHYDAVAKGIKSDSKEYFAHIEKAVSQYDGVKVVDPKEEEIIIPAEQTKPRDSSESSIGFDGAPPSRTVGTEPGGQWLDGHTYRPTPQEVEAAEVCGFKNADGSADVVSYIKAKYPEKFKR